MKYYEMRQNGSMLVGNMIALVILGVSATGLIYYTSTVQSATKSNIESVEYKPVLKLALINNLKSLLLEKNINKKGETSHSNIYGICSLINPLSEEEIRTGVTQVKLNLHQIQTKNDDNNWGEDRYQQFFPQSEYEFVSANECQTRFKHFRDNNNTSQCLKYTGSDQSEIYASVSWIPKTFPELSDIDTTNEAEAILDPKQVVFYLKVELAGSQINSESQQATPQGNLVVSSQVDMIWANEVGECHVPKLGSSGENILVQFSGTGPGSHVLDNKVINTPFGIVTPDRWTTLNGGDGCVQKIGMGQLNSDIVQAGNLRELAISSLPQLNARVSCTRNTFKCKQILDTNLVDDAILSGYDDFQFNFELLGWTASSIPVTQVNFTFLKNTKDNVEEWNNPEDNKKDDGQLYQAIAEWESSAEDDSFQNIPNHVIKVQGSIKNEDTNKKGLSKMCHRICQDYEPTQPNTYIYPAITIKSGESCSFKSEWQENHFNRVHCTVCYTKACHRFGLGTFGPFKEEVLSAETGHPTTNFLPHLPDEPLDGQLPECTVSNNNTTPPSVSLTDSSLGKCIALNSRETNNLTNFKSNTIYSAKNCTELLPVLCFMGGQYRPATKLVRKTDGQYELDVVTSDFKGAQKACMEMGRERGKAYDLGILLLNMWSKFAGADFSSNPENMAESTITELPSVNASFSLSDKEDQQKYDFINNATRGMFLAPPSIEVSYLTEKIKAQIIKANNKNTHWWVAMETDSGGLVMASPPWAEVTKAHPFALYFGKAQGNPITLVKDTSTLVNIASQSLSSSSPYLTLAYNQRWKGLYREKADEELTFLCKDSAGKFFVKHDSKGAIKSAGDENPYKKGHDICQGEGGTFQPPLHSHEWADAMLALNPNDEHLPFPDPKLCAPNVTPNRFLRRGRRQQRLGLLSNAESPMSCIPRQSNAFSYEGAIEIKRAWVALKLKSGFSGPVVHNDNTILAKVEDLRLIGNFSQDSLFYNPDENIPTSQQNMGIINGKGELKPLPQTTILAMDLKNPGGDYKKLCFNKSSYKLTVKAFKDSCPTNTEEVTGENLKTKYRKSIRFMLEWQDEVQPDSLFIIDSARLKKAKCKQLAIKKQDDCKKSCDVAYDTCTLACPADNQGTTHVNENEACKSSCETAKSTCVTSCQTAKDNADKACDDNTP